MANDLRLRDITEDDLPMFFEHQRDKEACRLAAFPSRERDAFYEHWKKILANQEVTTKAIVVDGTTVGNVVCFEAGSVREVGYWIGREHWGKGIATRALAAFLRIVRKRPLYARVAKHNLGSIRVLEKCGFVLVGVDKEFSVAGDRLVEGLIFRRTKM